MSKSLREEIAEIFVDPRLPEYTIGEMITTEALDQILQAFSKRVPEKHEKNIYRDKDSNLMCSTCEDEVFGGVCGCDNRNEVIDEIQGELDGV